MSALRAYREDDFAALVVLVQELMSFHRRLQQAAPLPIEEAKETARHWVDQPNTEVLLFEQAGRVAGVAKLRWDQGCPFLENLVVQSSRQRQGIGRAFLEAIEAHVQDNGADALFLAQVWPGNLAALDFYIACGYDILNTVELRKDFGQDRRGRLLRFRGRQLYLAHNVPEEESDASL
jgi:GNAT superfamily N-acetyltransferase